MASTRNKNTTGNYSLEVEGKREQAQYKVSELYSVPRETNFFGDGLLAGRVGPAKLSSNYCDIESDLRGIGATNLVQPHTPVVPDINQLKTLNIIDRIPLIIPKSYKHSNVERPFIGLTN
uniref:Uncharacterized protein n=1 Tax=viral metagenome TaxID=1070528 RepID=A0A6C0B6N8_9ZZZZ